MPKTPPPRTPQHRPRRRSASERRSQILREAVRCFASNGYRGTTTREIAAAVGITEAALYRYFGSKQLLYDAIIDQKIGNPPLQDLAKDAVARRDDEAVLTTIAAGLLERGLQDPDFVRLFLFTALEGHDLSDPFFKARIGGLRGFMTEYIETRIREGAFRDEDPGLAARAFVGMVSDFVYVRVVLAQGEAYPQSAEAVVATFVRIFLAGMRIETGSSAERKE